jgi:hypothetical protein
MISTQDYSALPDAVTLKSLCKALAALDAINSPDWEYRYYSYSADWAEGEEVLTMRDGEGDEMLVLFCADGCVVNGFLHEYDQPDKAQLTRGLPACFDAFIFGEPVNSIGTTFCLWYTPAHGWQTGVLEDEDDGSEELLSIFDGNPETYAEWADEYYGDETDHSPIDVAAVAQVYQGATLTKELVLRIVDEVEDWTQLAEDLQAIGYPYNFD